MLTLTSCSRFVTVVLYDYLVICQAVLHGGQFVSTFNFELLCQSLPRMIKDLPFSPDSFGL